MKIKIPNISKSEGMRQMENLVFPPGDYLLKITDIKVTDKVGEDDTVVGTSFQIISEVLGAENLPAGEDIRKYVGKNFRDFIFVMSPEHPKYDVETSVGGTIGSIGVAQMKSFLDATGVKIVNDEFDEKKAIGAWIETRVGVRSYKDKDGVDRKGNQVYSYAPHVDEQKVAESTPDDVEFDDDDLL